MKTYKEFIIETDNVEQFKVKQVNKWTDYGDPEQYEPDVVNREFDILKNGKKVGELNTTDYFGYVHGTLLGKDLPEISGYGTKSRNGPMGNLHGFLRSKTGIRWATTGKLRGKDIFA